MSGIEVEQVGQRLGARIERLVADPWQAPVVLDEARDRRLLGLGRVDEVLLGPRRHDEQREARARAAAAAVLAGGNRLGSALAGSVELVARSVRRLLRRQVGVVVP